MPDEVIPSSLADLQRRWQAEPSPQLSLRLAEELGRHDRSGEAVAVLESTLSAHPNHVAAQVALGRFQLELGQLAQACELLEGVVDQDPVHLVATKLLINAYLDLGRKKHARDRLDLYILLNAGDPEIEHFERRFDSPGAGSRPAVLFRLPSLPPPPPDLATLVPPGAPVAAADSDKPPAMAPAIRPVGPPAMSARRAPAIPRVAGTDPFPGIWEGVGTAAYWNRIGAEGIFPVPAPLRERATVTLGELYLKQGHFDEAQQTFSEVLERDPDNRAALVGLNAARSAKSSMTAPGEDTATKERKARALKHYLKRLRSGSDRMEN